MSRLHVKSRTIPAPFWIRLESKSASFGSAWPTPALPTSSDALGSRAPARRRGMGGKAARRRCLTRSWHSGGLRCARRRRFQRARGTRARVRSGRPRGPLGGALALWPRFTRWGVQYMEKLKQNDPDEYELLMKDMAEMQRQKGEGAWVHGQCLALRRAPPLSGLSCRAHRLRPADAGFGQRARLRRNPRERPRRRGGGRGTKSRFCHQDAPEERRQEGVAPPSRLQLTGAPHTDCAGPTHPVRAQVFINVCSSEHVQEFSKKKVLQDDGSEEEVGCGEAAALRPPSPAAGRPRV